MIKRNKYLNRVAVSVKRSPVTAITGPRQSGKTTLARMFSENREVDYFDLESRPDVNRLQNPEMVLGRRENLAVIDEIQRMPELFNVLRVLADRPGSKAKFLILGSASPDIIRNVSETLAGRIEFIELSGFDLGEISGENWEKRWIRGGYPRSYLSDSDEDSLAWREGFIRTFLERDIPQLGISIPSSAMRRFWTMTAHYHGQKFNASVLARSMGLSDKTVRSYLDILTGTYMIRQLQPWFANISKRQVKSPKIYLRDSGLVHSLLYIDSLDTLLGHPAAGASWEGFVIEQVVQCLAPQQVYYWATHTGAELDLYFIYRGRPYGMEIKFSEAPKVTKSMHTALRDLSLNHLWILYPGTKTYPVHEKMTVFPARKLPKLAEEQLFRKT